MTGQRPSSKSITSLDLEKHYHLTGERSGGPMEIRTSWKFADVKARAYYANGGHSYFASRFIKSTALALLKILPGTSPHTRYDTTRVTIKPIGPDEFLVTYDYSSFTTRLSELKYFIHYLSLTFDGVMHQVLDTHLGLINLDLGELLRTYNDDLIINDTYDVTRILDGETVMCYHQMRGGMLGAQGNIAFSTLLHGINVVDITGEIDQNCVVGDDCLLKTSKSEYEMTTQKVNRLGLIAADKFNLWESLESLVSVRRTISICNRACQLAKHEI
jgi:hypothetical protein